MLFAVVVLHGATIAVSSVEPAADTTTALLGQACFLMLVLGLLWRYGTKNLRRRERVRAGGGRLTPRFGCSNKFVSATTGR